MKWLVCLLGLAVLTGGCRQPSQEISRTVENIPDFIDLLMAEDGDVAEVGIAALVELPAEAVVPALIERIEQRPTDYHLSLSALVVATRDGAPEFFDVIKSLLRSPVESIRGAAMEYLATYPIGDEEKLALLFPIPDTPYERLGATRGIAKWTDVPEGAIELMQQSLRSLRCKQEPSGFGCDSLKSSIERAMSAEERLSPEKTPSGAIRATKPTNEPPESPK